MQIQKEAMNHLSNLKSFLAVQNSRILVDSLGKLKQEGTWIRKSNFLNLVSNIVWISSGKLKNQSIVFLSYIAIKNKWIYSKSYK